MEYYTGYLICGVVILFAFIASLIVQNKVQSNYNKFIKVASSIDLTGVELVEQMARRHNVEVFISRCKGKLSDHYNPKNRSINISEENYNSKSISAHAIVAHEFGHALQHAESYQAYNIRQTVVKVSNFVSGLLIPMIIVGLILELVYFASAGRIIIYVMCGVYALAVIAGLVTLPVEFNASKRAKKILYEMGATGEGEQKATAELLNSAAMTYVASLFVTLAYFMRILLLLLSIRRD